jgi:hypothetical protein
MQADSIVVLALMLGLLCMVTMGIWVRLGDQTRAEVLCAKKQLLACAGAVGAAFYLLLTA